MGTHAKVSKRGPGPSAAPVSHYRSQWVSRTLGPDHGGARQPRSRPIGEEERLGHSPSAPSRKQGQLQRTAGTGIKVIDLYLPFGARAGLKWVCSVVLVCGKTVNMMETDR